MALVLLLGALRESDVRQALLGAFVHVAEVEVANVFLCQTETSGEPVLVSQKGSKARVLSIDAQQTFDTSKLEMFGQAMTTQKVETEMVVNGALQSVVYWGATKDTDANVPWVPLAKQDKALLTETMHELSKTDFAGFMKNPQMAFAMMKVRASARLNAKLCPSPASSTKFTSSDIDVIADRRPYTNYFSISEMDLKFAKVDGAKSDLATRATFLATDAAIVLPYDPKNDLVMLVEQFRMGPFLRSDPHPWLMEPIAGRIDAGENPKETAMREALEEADLEIDQLLHVHSGYASPGCSTEFFHVYIGVTSIDKSAPQIGGLDNEQEDILRHVLEYRDFAENLNKGLYPVTPLALAGYWLAQHRDRLRAQA